MKKKILILFISFLLFLTFNMACAPFGGDSGSGGPSPRLSTEADENIEVYFAPAQDIHQHIISNYDNAQKSIHVAIYSLTKNEFADALIRAHQRGVEVMMNSGDTILNYISCIVNIVANSRANSKLA